MNILINNELHISIRVMQRIFRFYGKSFDFYNSWQSVGLHPGNQRITKRTGFFVLNHTKPIGRVSYKATYKYFVPTSQKRTR